jgi:hypothetical protein
VRRVLLTLAHLAFGRKTDLSLWVEARDRINDDFNSTTLLPAWVVKCSIVASSIYQFTGIAIPAGSATTIVAFTTQSKPVRLIFCHL